MAALSCPKCGAGYEAQAKFCRQCGSSLGPGEPSINPSEATTRSMDYPPVQNPAEASGTAPANQWPTAPAYLAPDQVAVGPQHPSFPVAGTQALGGRRGKGPIVILGILGFVLILVIAAFALILYQVVYRGSPGPPANAAYAPPPPPDPGRA